MQRHLCVTLPVEWIEKIDKECEKKGMTKYRYVLRLLEKAYPLEQKGWKIIERKTAEGKARTRTYKQN
jgi:hypothetical protein